MKYKTDMLVTETDSLDEWTSAWSELRGRHPFFLCGEISSKKVRILEFFKDIIPAIPTLKEIDVIIHSPGGKLDASFKAPYFFKTFCPNYVAVIPRYAKSGATLFSLGASEILMGQWAELT